MKKIQDERIVQERRQINANAFGLALIGLWILISIRLFILQQEILEFIDIFALTMILSIYVLVHTIMKGNYQQFTNKTMSRNVIILGGFIGTTVFALTQVLFTELTLNTISDILGFIVSLVIFWFVWVLGQFLFMYLSQKRANKEID